MSGKIILSPEYLHYFLYGKLGHPNFSSQFPAQLLETDMLWEDLVLNEDTLGQLTEIKIWLAHGKTLLQEWGMGRKVKRGYRALFYGPPGTGKTLTASLLGKYYMRPVFRVDLSMVISKFIGETEKNLSLLFDKASSKNWILFFDEADALLGKRTQIRDAHDKYANQEAAYLLQRIEDFDGLVVLATNLKENIDEAFIRRFQSIVHFPFPGQKERLELWEKAFPPQIRLAENIDLNQIAKKYKLNGANILNITQYCCLMALHYEIDVLREELLLLGISREVVKEGRIL